MRIEGSSMAQHNPTAILISGATGAQGSVYTVDDRIDLFAVVLGLSWCAQS
jgi:hypothetical protein